MRVWSVQVFSLHLPLAYAAMQRLQKPRMLHEKIGISALISGIEMDVSESVFQL
jgi:hypothetical protein